MHPLHYSQAPKSILNPWLDGARSTFYHAAGLPCDLRRLQRTTLRSLASRSRRKPHGEPAAVVKRGARPVQGVFDCTCTILWVHVRALAARPRPAPPAAPAPAAPPAAATSRGGVRRAQRMTGEERPHDSRITTTTMGLAPVQPPSRAVGGAQLQQPFACQFLRGGGTMQRHLMT